MTTRHLIEVTASELQEMAFNARGDIEIDTARSLARLRIGDTTYVAEITEASA